VIDNDNLTVWVEVEEGTDLTQLLPAIFVSAGASVDPPSGSMQDFTNPVTYTVTSENGQVENEWIVTVTVTTGLVEIKETDFLIYPNPTANEFKVQSQKKKVEEATIELYDLNGRKLLKKSIPKGQESTEVDVSGLQSGVYFCRLISKNKSVTKKLIIQR